MKHLRVFFLVLGKTALYFIVPVLILEIILALPFVPDRDVLKPPLYSVVLDMFIIAGVYFLFGYYSQKTTDVIFRAKIEIKKIVQLIPISLVSRAPIVILLIVLYSIFGDMINETVDKGVEFQWAIFDPSTIQTSILGFLSFVILGPIQEEMFFRGVLQRGLQMEYSPRTSIIYTSIIFGLIHGHPGLMGSAFILGLFLGYIYYKWDNLWYSMILHMFMNLLPFILQLVGSYIAS